MEQLKAFRGTLIAVVLLLVAGGAVWMFDPDPEGPPVDEGVPKALFVFEKQELVQVAVSRPDGVVVTLVEEADGWIIAESGFPAAKNQVNRVKHQLHDLTARATVVEDADGTNLPLYGLGPEQAIDVTLTFRDGSTEHFRAGDPNPSGVSYYLLKDDGTVYTVKKSAVDYYALELDAFRERRFASFNSKDADRIDATLEGGRRLVLQRTGDKSWDMLEPVDMVASLEKARSLLGRVSVLKASEFQDLDDTSPETLAAYGLAEPRARITLSFGSRPPMTLLVGDDTTPTDPPHAFMMLEGGTTVYTARVAFLDDYNADPSAFRSRRVLQLQDDDVVQSVVEFHANDDPGLVDDPVTLNKVGDTWMWWDGSPVPGSTPRRVAERVVHLDSEEFVDDADAAALGLDRPQATVTLTDVNGDAVTVRVGDHGPSRTLLLEEGDERELKRVYVQVEGDPTAHLVDAAVLSVLEDAVREQARKRSKVDDQQERQDKIPEAFKEDGQ